MATISLKKENDIIQAKVSGKLLEKDFDKIELTVDTLLKESKHNSILLDLSAFEGWEDFTAFVNHMEFIKEHHKYIKKMAVIGADKMREVLLHIVSMLANVDVRIFSADERLEAETWLRAE